MDQDKKNSNEYVKELSRKKKVEWFLQYHGWKIAVPIGILLLIVYLMTCLQKETQETLISIALVNAKMETFEDIKIQTEYEQERKQAGLPVRLYAELVYKESENALDTFTVASIQKYSNLLTNGEIDVTISDQAMVTSYEKADAYCNLELILPKKLRNEYSDKFFYANNSKGERIPVGIVVTDNKRVSDFYKEPPIVTISSHSNRVEEAIRFLEWFLAS